LRAAFLGRPGHGARDGRLDDRAADSDQAEGDADNTELGGGAKQEIASGQGGKGNDESRFVAETVGERSGEDRQEVEGACEYTVDDAVDIGADAKLAHEVDAQHHDHAVVGQALEELHHNCGVEGAGKLTDDLQVHGRELYRSGAAGGYLVIARRPQVTPAALPVSLPASVSVSATYYSALICDSNNLQSGYEFRNLGARS